MGVDQSGQVALLHDLNRYVWHSAGPGANETSVGIVYTGIVQPNSKQLEGLKQAISWCQSTLRKPLQVRGHKDNYATACPGPKWPEWKEAITP